MPRNLLKHCIVLSLLLVSVSCGGGREENEETASPESPGVSVLPGIGAAADSTVKVTFIELGSDRCVPCRMMRPIVEDVEKKYGDRVRVVYLDVGGKNGREYVDAYGLKAIPTQIFLDSEGKEYYRHVGFLPEREIVRVLKLKGVE